MKDDGTQKVECKCGNVIRIAPGAKLATPHCPVCGAEMAELRKHTRPKPKPKKAKA